MPRLTLLLCFGLGVMLAGCGGSAEDSVRSSVATMQSAIQTYNRSKPADLSATSLACQKAYVDLGGAPAGLTAHLGGRQAREEQVLHAAYMEARAGFRDCASGASTLNFPQFIAAEQHLSAANAAITRARRMER